MKKIYKEFSEINGEYIEEIPGQDRFGFGLSDMDDFFEIEEIIKHDGFYKGSLIRFYDYQTGKVYQPFERQKKYCLRQANLYRRYFLYFTSGF